MSRALDHCNVRARMLLRSAIPSGFSFAQLPSPHLSRVGVELAHSTGHSKRLDRGIDTDPKAYGSADYSKEELVAETAAAFLCGHAGIIPAVIENQAAYMQGWLKQLKNDKRLIVTAAGAGQRATDWILGSRPDPARP